MLEAGASAETRRGGKRKRKREDDKLGACGSRKLGRIFQFGVHVDGCASVELKKKSGALLGVVVACYVCGL